MPSWSPSFSWLMPSIIRRKRTRLPTWMSIGFGCFLFAIRRFASKLPDMWPGRIPGHFNSWPFQLAAPNHAARLTANQEYNRLHVRSSAYLAYSQWRWILSSPLHLSQLSVTLSVNFAQESGTAGDQNHE